MKEVDVQIRRAQGVEDYQKVVELEKQVWGYTDPADLAAVPILMIANRFGGAVLVAENPAHRMIGFAMANLGWTSEKKSFWWSHMTAVVDEYRNKGLGLLLKLRQRDEALASGIDEIQWTFDPLQAVNAHFNLHKLGVIVRQYEENVYGYSSSRLHQGLPTDRLIAEWHLKSDQPKRFDDRPVFLEIPENINQLRRTDLVSAKAWQDRVRVACQQYFREGYVIVDFVQGHYVLTKTNAG
ncbi:MAG TPA: acetyltransferase [Terriglobia bacterium]|nr:acetyltransferase [Terriglobia bacterium]